MTDKHFPKYVYSDQGSHYVKDQDELDALDVGQTYESPAEVPKTEAEQAKEADSTKNTGSAPEVNERTAPEILGDGHTERDRLEMEANTVGLKTSRTWTDEVLRRKILEHASK